MSALLASIIAASRRRSGGGGGFSSPLDYSPYFWLDAQDITTLRNGGSASAPGGNITDVRDKSGNGRNFWCPTWLGYVPPTRLVAGINGYNSIDNQVAYNLLVNTNLVEVSADWVVFLVWSKPNAPAFSSFPRLYSGPGPGGNPDFSGGFYLGGPGSGGTAPPTLSTTAHTAPLISGAGMTLGTSNNGFYSLGEQHVGLFGEFIMYRASDLDAAKIANVQSYLTTKWAL